MPFFKSDGLNIYYEAEGNGPEVVMVHGFESNLESNWRNPGMTDALKTENRCIMMDCRGHGKSVKPCDPKIYGSSVRHVVRAVH